MIAELNARGFPAYGADLTRLGWITGLIPSAFSPEYWTGNLLPSKTLKFYYEAIDRALEEIDRNHPGSDIHIVGHSIGGWVARGWLGDSCSEVDRGRVLSLTTLGTPNRPPPADGAWAAFDQTRGLLTYINGRYPGAFYDGVEYTSVVGTALQGKFPGSLEEMLAFVSFLPLQGDGQAVGDGIVPRDVGIMDGSRVIELPEAKHSGFIPFPGEAIKLEGYPWYGTPALVDRWLASLEAVERSGPSSGGGGGGGPGGLGSWFSKLAAT